MSPVSETRLQKQNRNENLDINIAAYIPMELYTKLIYIQSMRQMKYNRRVSLSELIRESLKQFCDATPKI